MLLIHWKLLWRVPCEENYEEIIKTLMDEVVSKQTGNFLAYRLNVEPTQFCRMLNIQKSNNILDLHSRFVIKEKLLNDTQIKHFILKSNEKRIENLNKYIKQDFDLNKNDIALVDVNGSGRTIDLLSEFI